MEKSEDDFGKYQRQIESEDKNEKKIKTRLMVGMIKRKGKKKGHGGDAGGVKLSRVSFVGPKRYNLVLPHPENMLMLSYHQSKASKFPHIFNTILESPSMFSNHSHPPPSQVPTSKCGVVSPSTTLARPPPRLMPLPFCGWRKGAYE